jgi:hypothetical protein
VAGIYNRSSYATEKRAALELWARHLMASRGPMSSEIINSIFQAAIAYVGALLTFVLARNSELAH